jgi:nitrite reductase/ring-hydroxylating ferredoxin subunit/uncharacterized membrane protein
LTQAGSDAEAGVSRARPGASGRAFAWAEALTRPLERSASLDSAGKTLTGLFSNVVRPGSVKDVLSGTWMSHPLHPILTDVTIGAWTSAFVLDLVGGEQASAASDTLVGVGVLSAVPTALTGLSDLADVVNSEERSIGAAHALGNVTGVFLYGLSYLARRRGGRGLGTVLSTLGATVMTAAGFLGGHLAYRRGIGVDQTVFEPTLEDWTVVIDEDELAEGEPRRESVSGADLLLYRSGDDVYALASRCSHRGGPLDKGTISEGTVTCPWHRSTFSLADGSVLRGPATAPQPAYDTRVRDGKIEVRARQ